MKKLSRYTLILCALCCLSACSSAALNPTMTPTASPLPTNTLLPSSTPLPTQTPLPSATATLTRTPPPPATQTAEAYATGVANLATQVAFATDQRATEAAIYAAQTGYVLTQMVSYNEIDPQELVSNTSHYVGDAVKVKITITQIIDNQTLQGNLTGTNESVIVDMSEAFSGISAYTAITVYGTVAGTQCSTDASGTQVCLPWITKAFYDK